jgi:putative PIN family toxin of toxin-antitoxin system
MVSQIPARDRVVIDTNAFVSHILRIRSIPSRAVIRAQQVADIPISPAIAEELRNVIRRPKFDRYVSAVDREATLSGLLEAAKIIEPSISIQACRHPKDDNFLELAVDGHADLILSGDRDLLVLSPFPGIPIVTPTQYLAED